MDDSISAPRTDQESDYITGKDKPELDRVVKTLGISQDPVNNKRNRGEVKMPFSTRHPSSSPSSPQQHPHSTPHPSLNDESIHSITRSSPPGDGVMDIQKTDSAVFDVTPLLSPLHISLEMEVEVEVVQDEDEGDEDGDEGEGEGDELSQRYKSAHRWIISPPQQHQQHHLKHTSPSPPSSPPPLFRQRSHLDLDLDFDHDLTKMRKVYQSSR